MKDFCIITNCCHGFQYYNKNNKEYNTPFVSMSVNIPCYLKIIKNIIKFKQLLPFKLNNTKYLTYITPRIPKCNTKPIDTLYESLYPLFGINLDNEIVEIHNIHNTIFKEAEKKWIRRCNRMPDNLDKYIFLFHDLGIEKMILTTKKFKELLKEDFIKILPNNKIQCKNTSLYYTDRTKFDELYKEYLIYPKKYSDYVEEFLNLGYKNQIVFCKYKNKDSKIDSLSKNHNIIFYPDHLGSAPCIYRYLESKNINIIRDYFN